MSTLPLQTAKKIQQRRVSARVRELFISGTNRNIAEQTQDVESQVKLYNNLYSIYSCVFEITSAVKKPKLQLFEKNSQNEFTELKEFPEYIKRPNKFQSWKRFIESHFGFLELTGSSYWEKTIDDSGYLQGFYLVPSQYMQVIKDVKEFISGYIMKINRKELTFLPKEIISFRYFNPEDQYYGTSPISSLRYIAASDIYAEQYNYRFFLDDSSLHGHFETSENLNKRQYRQLKHDLVTKRRGVKNIWDAPILEGGLKWIIDQISHKDMDFLKQKEMAREIVCGVFGVPPGMIGVMRYANYANLAAQERIFWLKTIIPKMIDFEDELSYLISNEEQKEIVAKHNYTDIEALQPRFKEESESARGLYVDGIVTRNEARQIMNDRANMTLSIDDPEGDVYFDPFLKQAVASKEQERIVINNYQQRENEKSEFDKETEYWQRVVAKTEKHEEKFITKMIKLFNRQEKLINKNIGILFNPERSAETRQIEPDLDWQIILNGIDDFLDWYVTELESIYLESATDLGNDILNDLAPGIAFNVNDPRVLEYIGERMRKYSTTINDSTKEAIRKKIIEGFKEGEGEKLIKNRIKEVFTQAKDWRAKAIARTEINSSGNKVRHLAARQAMDEGVPVSKKKWIHSRDSSVRETHIQQGSLGWVAFDYMFTPGGDQMEAPGQGSEASQNINCRCNCVYGVDEF